MAHQRSEAHLETQNDTTKVAPQTSLLSNLILLFSTCVAIVLIAEGVSYVIFSFYPNTHRGDYSGKGWVVQDIYPSVRVPRLGWRAPLSKSIHAKVVNPSGESVYDVVYTIDELGRRVTPIAEGEHSQHLILFGGSTSFSTGLSDADSLQSQLGKHLPGTHVYNYATWGWGPNQMLSLLENRNLKNEISEARGLGLYLFIDHHIDRAIGSSLSPWALNGPYYEFREGTVQTLGSFHEVRPILSKVYDAIDNLQKHSFTLRLLRPRFPISYNSDDSALVAAMILKSKQLYESQFSGTFVVAFHPLYRSRNTAQIVEIENILRKNKVPILRYDIERAPEHMIPADDHPNAAFTAVFAEKLASDVLSLLPAS